MSVILGQELTLQQFLNNICVKAILAISYISRIRKHLSLDNLKRIVNAFVISILDYCEVEVIVVDISRAAKERSKYPPRAADAEVSSCFSTAYTKRIGNGAQKDDFALFVPATITINPARVAQR